MLSHYVCLLQDDGKPKGLESLRKSVHQRLQFPLGVSCNCCVVSKEHVSDEVLADLRHGFEAGEVE